MRYLILGQTALGIMLLVNILLFPSVVYSNQGISHFGVQAKTIFSYGVGFLACSYLTLLAAHAIPARNHQTITLKRALILLSLLLFAILLTPFSLNVFFDWSHMIVAGLLFSFELVFSAWLLRNRSDVINRCLFAIQVAGSLSAGFSLLNTVELMFIGQLVVEIAFSILLVRTSWTLLAQPEHPLSAHS